MHIVTRLMIIILLGAAAFGAAVVGARAQQFDANALVDLGGVLPSNQRTFTKGGLGKLEFGGQTPRVTGQVLADVRGQLVPSLSAYATMRLAPDQHAPFDVLEAYLRYQPVSTKSWLLSVKGGAFLPPISLENESTGWTSPWTLTPSAINTWVGDELRTIGGEADIEWRHTRGAIGLTGAVFGANDPAGTLLAERGWAFDSRPTGLLGEPRRPDVVALAMGLSPPLREELFKEIDGQPGWYAGASLRQDGIGRVAALYYDNRADPGLFIGNDFGWRTKFTSLGAEVDIDDVVLLSQAMFGQTTIEPADEFYRKTNFQSAYLLAGYYFGDYRIAARIDVFATQLHNSPGGSGPSEHEHAVTLAGTWTPLPWLRLTGELLHVDSDRGQRAAAGLAPSAKEVQFQLVGRVLF